MERALFFFLPLGVINGVKSPYKTIKLNVERTKCVHGRHLFLISFEQNYGADFLNNPYLKQDTQHLCQWRSWTKVEGPNSSPGSFYFLPLMSKREEAPATRKVGLNWTKESWDNAHVWINSALIVFTPCFNFESFCAIQ